MKSLFKILFGGALCLFSLFACQQPATADANPDKKANPYARVLNPKDTISLKKFQDWTQNWAKLGGTWASQNELTYFQMPLIDLTETLGEQPAFARFYMGLDTTTRPYTPHLLLVGENDKKQPMIDPRAGNYVYDVTNPCPPSYPDQQK